MDVGTENTAGIAPTMDDKALIAGLKALSGVNDFAQKCSVCGKSSDKGWGVGLRKDWQNRRLVLPGSLSVQTKMKSAAEFQAV